MTSGQIATVSSGSCPTCHQSKSIDNLTGRCTTCQPIQLSDLDPLFQNYARSARTQKYTQLLMGLLLGPAAIGILLFYSSRGKGVSPLFFWFIVLATAAITGMSIHTFARKKQSLLRYYRLSQLGRIVTPVDALLQYQSRNRGARNAHCYFKLWELGPGSTWPEGLGQRIQIDIPPRSQEKVVTGNFWKRFFSGYDPGEKPKLWAKVYFDPDQSGSAVIRIADSVFVTVSENN
jgi:hypothetical protein